MKSQFQNQVVADVRRRKLRGLAPTHVRSHRVPKAPRNRVWGVLPLLAGFATASLAGPEVTVFETTSVYHHIRVVDQDGARSLCFNDGTQSRMLLRDPTQGHCEYTEYFHMPWLWNSRLTNVLMIGLGGASTQRAYQRLYPDLTIETVEIDPMVEQVAGRYFTFRETPRQKVHVSDGRVFLRRSSARYDALLVDAYVHSRYGSSIPYHLATKEFFVLASNHLTTNGVLAYNVIGTMQGWQADLMGSIYKTLKTVFPQVYFFPARESLNVVVIATKSAEKVTAPLLQQRAAALARNRRVTPPGFAGRVLAFRAEPPVNAERCAVLTDDFAPVEGLVRTQ
jgi:spermidine synthase